ncbi:hypothetical protein KC909_01710 [Candidatus Dojkabacteria bacterium]|uniref:Uncharacterized protein n=1 Tax=Candidatus Dojkabacteria bacterium TaxID=2099670 RepID=A0A955L567_9BACT|nr:hypothetical protein [Candidatus Dojkabacteria bacterium]
MIDQGPITPQPGKSLEETYPAADGYDWNRFKEIRISLGFATDIFTRRHIIVFNDILAQCQADQLPVNLLLQYIDPRSRADVGGESYRTTLGYFLESEAIRFQSRDGVEKAGIIEHLHNIDATRMNIIAISGAQHPNLWNAEREIYLETPLPTDSTSNPAELYLDAVGELLDYIEASYVPEEVTHYLLHRYREAEYALTNNIGRGHQPLSDAQRDHLERTLVYLGNGLDRYQVEY